MSCEINKKIPSPYVLPKSLYGIYIVYIQYMVCFSFGGEEGEEGQGPPKLDQK